MNRFTPIGSVASRPRKRASTRRYWAFLSYAHEDSKAAGKLHNMLERYRVPKPLVGSPHPLGAIPKRLTPVFRDRQELAASSNLGREIREALQASNCFIVLCSPHAARSRWVDQEIRDFKRLHGEDRVFAAILDGEPFSGDTETECFPPALRYRTGPDGKDTEEPAEPIAADLRVEGDGWRDGFLKIVAGMLDVGLDDLVQRDQQRRQKRMAWISAASIAGMTVTSGLAIFALSARDAAREERLQAEGLVEFMLGDLTQKLQPIGKLDALDGVGARVIDYYRKRPTGEIDDAGLLQRSRALSLAAQVAYLRFDFDQATRLYREAMEGTQEAINRNPSDPQRLFDHAQSVFWIGEIERGNGRLEQAEAAYREYQRLADQMVALDPTNPKWRMETVYARQLTGIVLFDKRDYNQAASLFQSALRPMQAMAAANPDDDGVQLELSTMLAWLADARRDQGRLREAADLRFRQIALLTRLEEGSTDVKIQAELIPARQALGILLSLQGQKERAIVILAEAVGQAERLIPVEPDNGLWKRFAASARSELAWTLLDLSRFTAASRQVEAACQLTSDLRRKEPTATTWRDLQTNCRLSGARLALAQGNRDQASLLAREAMESARTERNADPLRSRYRMALAGRLMGDVRRRSGDLDGARQAYQSAFAALPSGVPERPREIIERITLLERLGRTDEARALTGRISAMGWKP